ncbi:hypothetical protein ACHWQZ_G001835 [Mnemiopsis leidyi]
MSSSGGSVQRVTLAPKPPTQPLRKPIPPESLAYVRSIVSTIVKVEGDGINQSVLTPIYTLLMGSENSDYIRDPAAIWILLELLPYLNHALQMEIWQRLISIVGRSLRNLQMCCTLALVPHCLDLISECESENQDAIASRIAEFVGTITSYDLSVDELRLLLDTLTSTQGKWPAHSTKLLTAMRMMPKRTIPEIMFNFTGELGSAITIPPLARWPTNPGFTVNMWVSFDPRFMLPNYKPFLYWFKTGRGLGYSANISNQCIWLETVTGKGQITGKMTKTPSKVEKRLDPHTWYMISVVYVYHRMKSCEVLCYINGRLALRQDVGFVNTSEPFDKCYIGSSPRTTVETSFCGQMSSISLFGDCLPNTTISALYRLGADYKHAFQYRNEHDVPIPAADQNIIYSGKLASSLIFSYNPKACNGQLCFEVSQNPLYDYFVNSSHAILLDGVETVATRNVQSTLHSLGGIQVLLPLFQQLSSCSDSTPELCATLLWLFIDLVKSSATCQSYVTTHRSLLVISHLLFNTRVEFLSEAALEAFLSLGRTLVEIKQAPLLNSLINDILLRTEMWVKTSVQVQVKLYSTISTEFVGGADSCDVRQSLNVSRIINVLREYYWVTPEQGALCVEDRHLTPEDVKSIRAFLVLSAKQSLMKTRSPESDDISSILSYLVSNQSEDHLVDMLQLLLALMSEHHAAILPKFDELGGVKVLFQLLKHDREIVRLFSLKTIGSYLNACPAKQSVKLVSKSGIFTVVAEHLASCSDRVTIATYNVLMELLTNHISRQITGDRFLDTDPDAKIKYPQLLEVIAVLLLKLPTHNDPGSEESRADNSANMNVCKEYLTTLLVVLQRSRDNRRTLISQNGWQRWLVGLMMQWVGAGSEGHHVTDLAYSLFQTLLHHALQWEQDGWLVWVETLSILHTYQCEGQGIPVSVSVSRTEEDNTPVPEQSDSCRADDEASCASENKVPDITVEQETPQPGGMEDVSSSVATEVPENNGQDDHHESNAENEILEKMTSDETQVVKNETEEIDRNKEDTEENDRNKEETVGNESESKEAVEIKGDEQPNTVDSSGTPQLSVAEIAGENGASELENWLDEDDGTQKPTEEHKEEAKEDSEDSEEGVAVERIETVEEARKKRENSDSGVEEEEDISDISDVRGLADPQQEPTGESVQQNEDSEEKEEEPLKRAETEVISEEETSEDKIIVSEAPAPEADTEISLEDKASESLAPETVSDDTPVEEATTPGTNEEETETEQPSGVPQEEEPAKPAPANNEGEEDEAKEGDGDSENLSKSSSEPRLVHQCIPLPETRFNTEDDEDSADHAPRPGYGEEVEVPLPEDVSLSVVSDPPEVESEVNSDVDNQGLVLDSEEEPPPTPSQSYKKPGDTGPWPGYPFNPAQWRFSTLPGFQWSLPHQRLLSDLLVALSTTMKLWKSGQRSTSEMVNARDNGVYMTNIAHIISLTADNLVVECGGVGKLVNEITVPGKPSQDNHEPVMEFEKAYQLVELLVGIVDTVVFCSVLNFNLVESARSLKQGGMMRIALRLVTCLSTINCLKKRQRQKLRRADLVPEVVQEEINSKLTPLGIVGEPLRMHLLNKLEQRHTEDLKIDYLLEEKDVYYLRSCVMRDLDLYMKESEQQALQVLFYLSVLTVTQYHEIVNKHRGGNNITEQVQRALVHVGPLLNDLLLDFQGFFAKTILGTHGRELFNESLSCFKGEVSVVELAMQLCSQEWLTALERHAGVSFTKLLREGRHVASSTDEYLVKLALWSENVAAEAIAEHIVRAAEFEMSSKQIVSALLAEQHNTIRLLHSQQKQSVVTGEKGWEYVQQFSQQLNQECEHITHYRLDSWEDSSRRRYKMLYNPAGTSHLEAVMHPTNISTQKSEKGSSSPSHVIVAQHLAQSQQHKLPPEEDEELDAVVDENDVDTKKGNLLFSERATLLLPGRRVTGTLTITKLAVLFSASELREEENYKFYNVDVSAVFTRRYLHLYRALEVFTIGHKSWLFVLADYEAVRRAVASLPRVGVGLQYGLPSRRQISLAHPRRLLRESNMMDKWRCREISNFDYLMFLNTIAGRSYNDLGQYPIMPWVLKNYTDETLDLTDPGNYRDLSRPIGAQTAERAAKFRDKFEMSREGVAPPFHYGTHYSTPGFVLMWLLRLEPYTTLFLKLQSGKFDHPCRIFSSIGQAWDNCQRDMADVKELIPELFYLPELFVNDNQYELGLDDEGNSVNTVKLPPWAKDHHHFLQIHRDALESEYVSSHLHQWIDLIFGVSQRGDQAEAAINSFYYTTYEGLCDPSQVEDPVIKEALEEQIRSFGQTPPQLLTTPHPARNSIQHVLNANIKNLNGIVSVLNPVKDQPVTVVKPLLQPSLHPSPLLLTLSANQTITTNKFVPSIQNAYQVFVESDPAPRSVKDPVDPTLSSLPSTYAVSPDGKVLFCAGFWDSSFKSFSVESGKQVQSMFGHRDLVTCISVTESNISLHIPHTRLADGIIVTGSRDATVCVWDWNGKLQRVSGIDGRHASARSVLTGHVGQVECVHVSGEQGSVVSASRNSPILLHRVTGELIRKIKVPGQFTTPSSVLLTKRCEIVAHYADMSGYLAVFSANGDVMNTQELQEQVLSLISDKEGNYLITGGFNLTPVVRSIKTLSPVLRLAPCQSAVRVLALSQDQRFLIAGLTNGTINIYPVDLRRIVGDQYTQSSGN